MINPMTLDGKHILITGGSSGIGRECAIRSSNLGAHVTIIARNAENLKETIQLMSNPKCHTWYEFDLNETEEIETLINRIVKEQGSVDGFCHAAGISPVRTLKMLNNKFLEKMFRIHEYAFVEIIRSLSMKKNLNDGASLIGISSVAARRGSFAHGAYSAAKASMEGILASLAMELSSRRIRINAVSFGMVDTNMYQDFLNYGDENSLEKQYLGVIDLESAANMITFLLSDACKYITASTIPVWAGV